MADRQEPQSDEERVRALALRKGYQLRRADHSPEMWHLVDPDIDGKVYAFSFTKPHSFKLEEIEQMLQSRPNRPGGPTSDE